MVDLDAVVGVLGGVVVHVRQQLNDCAGQRRGSVRGHLLGFAMGPDRRREESDRFILRLVETITSVT